jgi:hypothetical protein
MARELDQVQRWLQSVIMHPFGIEAGIESPQARDEIDVGAKDVESVIGRSKKRTSLERLAVYGNAYYARLLECLREVFPVMCKWLGEDLFHQFALGYLQRYPSRTYTLDRLGAEFAQYLEETRPRTPASADGEIDKQAWPELLIDLARLEWTIGEVFDAPGVEGQTLLTAEEIAGIPPERWPTARLKPVGCLRLLKFRYPINDFFSQIRADEEPDLPRPQETYLALTRRDYVVRRYPLSRPQHELLQAIVEGATIEAAIARAAAVTDESDDELAINLREWFALWARAPLFAAIEQ